jgi:outer membrane protein OmpA-like peptidoglycan-associated protein
LIRGRVFWRWSATVFSYHVLVHFDSLISQLPPRPYIKRFVYDPKQIFEKADTAKLKHQKALNEAGTFLEEHKFSLAVVVAGTGMKGDSSKDRVLTEVRTAAVRDYLVQNYRLDDQRIKTMGRGKTRETGDGDKSEIIIYP